MDRRINDYAATERLKIAKVDYCFVNENRQNGPHAVNTERAINWVAVVHFE